MRRFFTLFLMAAVFVAARAQHGVLRFVGPSQFQAFTATVPVENDTVLLQLNVAGFTGDFTIPAMTYSAMRLTIPSFTVAGVPFVAAEDGGFDLVGDTTVMEVPYQGGTRQLTVNSLKAHYDHVAQHLTLEVKLNFGSMPFELTYSIEANYTRDVAAGIRATVEQDADAPLYDLQGRRVVSPVRGQIYIQNGRKRMY
jgi:hypothetical protein